MELINGRTADEIKRGMRCQGSKGNIKCSECVYCIGQFGDSDCDYECDQIDSDALALIERLEAAVPRWISVEERLPPPETKIYLIASHSPDGEQIVKTSVWAWNEIGETGDWMNWNEVTHWMPMPSAEGLK